MHTHSHATRVVCLDTKNGTKITCKRHSHLCDKLTDKSRSFFALHIVSLCVFSYFPFLYILYILYVVFICDDVTHRHVLRAFTLASLLCNHALHVCTLSKLYILFMYLYTLCMLLYLGMPKYIFAV
jgi:hypothetical protein